MAHCIQLLSPISSAEPLHGSELRSNQPTGALFLRCRKRAITRPALTHNLPSPHTRTCRCSSRFQCQLWCQFDLEFGAFRCKSQNPKLWLKSYIILRLAAWCRSVRVGAKWPKTHFESGAFNRALPTLLLQVYLKAPLEKRPHRHLASDRTWLANLFEKAMDGFLRGDERRY
jgi:hypothetical protein